MDAGSFEWIFVVDPLDGPDDERIDRMYEVIDGTVGSHGGLTLIDVTAQGRTATDAGLLAAKLLSDSGFVVARSHPDLVTRSDISERAAVTRQAVTNWVNGERHRSEPFPTPIYAVSGGVWLWGDVHEWLVRNVHIDGSDGSNYPNIGDHIMVDAALVEDPVRRPIPLMPPAARHDMRTRDPASAGTRDAGVPSLSRVPAAAFGAPNVNWREQVPRPFGAAPSKRKRRK